MCSEGGERGGRRGERGAGEQPHKCSEGRESRTTLRAATVVVFLPPRAVCLRTRAAQRRGAELRDLWGAAEIR